MPQLRPHAVQHINKCFFKNNNKQTEEGGRKNFFERKNADLRFHGDSDWLELDGARSPDFLVNASQVILLNFCQLQK